MVWSKRQEDNSLALAVNGYAKRCLLLQLSNSVSCKILIQTVTLFIPLQVDMQVIVLIMSASSGFSGGLVWFSQNLVELNRKSLV